MKDDLVAEPLVGAFLGKTGLVILVFLLEGIEVEFLSLDESLVNGCLGLLGVVSTECQLCEIALHDISSLEVFAGLHGTIHLLGLSQRVAAEQTACQYLLGAELKRGRSTLGGFASITQCFGMLVHGPADIGQRGQRLTDQLVAQRVTRGHGQLIGTAGIGQCLVEGGVVVEGQLARIRAHVIQ